MLVKRAKITNKGVYEKLGKLLEGRLDASDLILLVLLVSPVKGVTAMQKQVFIAWREIYKDVAVDAGYFPYLFGPYSRLVDDLLVAMKAMRLIDFKGGKNEGTLYTITPEGIKKIKEKMTRLKISTNELERRKKMWHDWTSRGYLQYVYRRHPEYAVESMVPSHKWE